MGLTKLQIFLSAAWQQATALYELLTNHCVGMALARHAEDKEAVFLPAEQSQAIRLYARSGDVALSRQQF